VVASLDKILYDDYLCLVVLNKQQINCKKVKKSATKIGNLIGMKWCVQIVQNIVPLSLS